MFPVFFLLHGCIQQRLTFMGIFPYFLFRQLDTEVHSKFKIAKVGFKESISKCFQWEESNLKMCSPFLLTRDSFHKIVGIRTTFLLLYKEGT